MKALEVHRVDGEYPKQELVDCFRRHGVVVLKHYLPNQSRARLRALVEQRLEAAHAQDGVLTQPAFPRAEFLLGDILAVRELEEVDYLFFRPDLLRAARAVLETEELLYWGDSSIQFGEAARGFHKDNVERHDASHDDWKGDYGLVRCGFYFQDHVVHSGGLKVRLASHNIANHLEGKAADIATRFGDLVMWSMRLTHSGNNRKLRGLHGVPLHPRLEAAAPEWAVRPAQMRRISAFCAFARPGSQADRYIENMNRRDADYRPYFQRARNPEEAAGLMQRYGVGFVKPNNHYGELDPRHA